MEKIALILAILTFTQAAIVPRIQMNDWSILKCKNGSLEGMGDLIQIIHETASLCGQSESKDQFFPCMAEGLGIMGTDGTPDLRQFQDLLTLVFSQTILDDLPDMKEDFMQCGHEFAATYNSLVSENNGVQDFFTCSVSVVQKYMEEIPKVCTYEFQFNGQ